LRALGPRTKWGTTAISFVTVAAIPRRARLHECGPGFHLAVPNVRWQVGLRGRRGSHRPGLSGADAGRVAVTGR